MADPTETTDPPVEELSFNTTLEGRPFTIDGHPYLIKHPDAFSLRDGGLIEFKRVQIWKLLMLPDRSNEQEVATERLLREFCVSVTTAPSEAIDKLAPAQLLEAFMAFSSLRSGQRAAAEAYRELMDALTEAVPIPGRPSSPDSPASTEATPSAGGPTSPAA